MEQEHDLRQQRDEEMRLLCQLHADIESAETETHTALGASPELLDAARELVANRRQAIKLHEARLQAIEHALGMP